MTDLSDKQILATAIIEYLQESSKEASQQKQLVRAESLEVAAQCIADAFTIDLTDKETLKQLSIAPAKLTSIFNVFLSKRQSMQQQQRVTPVEAESVKVAQEPALDDTARKAKADQLKSEGNAKLVARQFDDAVRLYSEAIELDSANAVYYCNRAAAYSSMNQHENAVTDCETSIAIDPNYSKAYSRYGFALLALHRYRDARDAYKRALQLDPENATLKAALKTCEARVKDEDEEEEPETLDRSNDPAGGAPAGLEGLLNNPQLAAMAQQMMGSGALNGLLQNPQMAAMAQQLMRDPSALSNLMGSLGNNRNGGNA